jgi:hypothetical protein
MVSWRAFTLGSRGTGCISPGTIGTARLSKALSGFLTPRLLLVHALPRTETDAYRCALLELARRGQSGATPIMALRRARLAAVGANVMLGSKAQTAALLRPVLLEMASSLGRSAATRITELSLEWPKVAPVNVQLDMKEQTAALPRPAWLATASNRGRWLAIPTMAFQRAQLAFAAASAILGLRVPLAALLQFVFWATVASPALRPGAANFQAQSNANLATELPRGRRATAHANVELDTKDSTAALRHLALLGLVLGATWSSAMLITALPQERPGAAPANVLPALKEQTAALRRPVPLEMVPGLGRLIATPTMGPQQAPQAAAAASAVLGSRVLFAIRHLYASPAMASKVEPSSAMGQIKWRAAPLVRARALAPIPLPGTIVRIVLQDPMKPRV